MASAIDSPAATGIFRPPIAMVSRISISLALFAVRAGAVIVGPGDGPQYLATPADDFGFSNVGLVWDSTDGTYVSGVYLGSGWVLSSYHGVRDASQTGFALDHVFFGGNYFTVAPGSAVRLHNPNSSLTDLSLFRLTSEPSLPALSIASAVPASGTAVSMMGYGLSRESSETHWTINTATDPDTWTETAGTGDAQGYNWAFAGALRWGTNQTVGGTGNVNGGFGPVTALHSTFENATGEAQASIGDSGGGVFWKVGGEWQLGGIMLYIDGLDGQPANTAVFGNTTYFANLSTYRTEIMATVPEPGSTLLLAMGAGMAAGRKRRNAQANRATRQT